MDEKWSLRVYSDDNDQIEYLPLIIPEGEC